LSQISQNDQNINREEIKESFTPNRDVPGSKAPFEQKKDFFENLKETENDQSGGTSVCNEQGNFNEQSGSIGKQGNLKTGTPGGSNMMSNIPSGTSVSQDSSCNKDTKREKSDSNKWTSQESSNIPTPPSPPGNNTNNNWGSTYGQGSTNNVPPGTSLNEKSDTKCNENDWNNQKFGKDLSGEKNKQFDRDRNESPSNRNFNEKKDSSSERNWNEKKDSPSNRNWNEKNDSLNKDK